jgi:hypothetical protein
MEKHFTPGTSCEGSMMSATKLREPETDPRFPSGPWSGFFVQPPLLPGRQAMELVLSFRGGELHGEGRDRVGAFTLRGRYDTADGTCYWHKHYVGKHSVYYRGFNEGKGIWGVWEITDGSQVLCKGGFHIWPEGDSGVGDDHLHAHADLPARNVSHRHGRHRAPALV